MQKYDMAGLLQTYSEQFARATNDELLRVILVKLKSEMKKIKAVTVENHEE